MTHSSDPKQPTEHDIGPADLLPGHHRLATLGSLELMVCRIGHEYFAIDNACPHAGAPLNEGYLEGTTVTCPFHGWAFDVKTGACVNVTSDGLETYPVRLKGGRLHVQIDREHLR